VRLLVAALLAALLAAAAATIAFGLDLDDAGAPARTAASPTGACGARSAATTGAVESLVARRIYAEELRGAETRLDAARVAHYRPLLGALARGDAAAVRAAVHALVYAPHWHIVRLRVSAGGRVLADVGGPHVLAPVGGSLRVRGRKLAGFVMSVQDDLGYLKLVTRFIGAPVDLYQRGAFVMGTLRPAPEAASGNGRVRAGGVAYLSTALAARAFPADPLQARLFVPEAPSRLSCAAVRVAAFGIVARHVAARLHPLSAHLRDLADILRTVTTGRVLVRSGARRIVGGGPARLPRSGSVRYAGRRWAVYSWQPLPAVRVFVLTPPA
jgi:hypothetical protein